MSVQQRLHEDNLRYIAKYSTELAWIRRYLVEAKFPKRHLDAVCAVVGLFNDCEEAEAEIFEFADTLFKKYAG